MTSMKRSEPPSSGTVTSEGLKPEDRNPELADAKARKHFVEHSGNLAVTNHDFKALYGIFMGFEELGLDLSALRTVFKEFEKLTPDPQSRKDVLQMFATPKIVIPGVGAGALGGVEEKPGLIRGAWKRLTGKGGEGE